MIHVINLCSINNIENKEDFYYIISRIRKFHWDLNCFKWITFVWLGQGRGLHFPEKTRLNYKARQKLPKNFVWKCKGVMCRCKNFWG